MATDGSLTAGGAYTNTSAGGISSTNGYHSGGQAGASGTFTTTDLKTVTVVGGIIVSIV